MAGVISVPGGGEDPVFILCAARSGSTLLRFLLDAHPDLACPPETKLPWLARQLAAAWAVIEDTPPPAAPDGAGPDTGAPDTGAPGAGPGEDAVSELVAAGLRRSLEPMIAAALARRGKKRFCDKSLGAAQHAGLLLRIWPGARFICLYRHPMDVIGSGLEASPWGLTGYGFEPYVASPPDSNVAALARYWLDYTTAIVAAEDRFADRCLPVRYEDLVTEPEREAQRVFAFIGARPAPGIADRCLGQDHQRFGPGDYKIWNTAGITSDSVGRGWSVPARLIPAPVLDRVNELADVLGYVPVTRHWGVGPRPADLIVPATPAVPATPVAPAASGTTAVTAPVPPAARGLDTRIRSGLARRSQEFARSHGSRASESVLLFATATATATATAAATTRDADAWWLLDLAAGTLTGGSADHGPNQDLADRLAAADWSVTGSARAWERVLAGEVNLGVAFRRGDLRYADNGDAGAGSPGADGRVAMLADLLGLRARPVAGTS
jgi:hypothetical protein